MVHACWINGCTNRSDREPKRSWHSIPTVRNTHGEQTQEQSEERRRKWLENIGRKETPSKHSRVCSDHFVTGKPADLYNKTHPDWAPTLKLSDEIKAHKSHQVKQKPDSQLSRYVRVIDRKRRKVETGVAAALLELSTTDINKDDTDLETPKEEEATLDIQVNEAEADGSDEQDTGVHDENDSEMLMKMMRDEVQQLTTENMKLRDELQSFKFSEEVFENNEEKVRYFTGLPKYILLMGIFNIVEPYIVVTGKSVLSKFEQFVMVLMRLRLNLSVQDLAYRFRVSRATVSRVFNSVIHVMYMRMKNYIVWPEREELRRTMPMEFRKRFGVKVAIIIDCFEVFIERPSNLLARSQTWSNYKHNNTVKFLIGITPQGSVSFLSAAYGGRASDKFITEDCGILNALLPGDIVLADRGFNIAESVGLMCAEVKIPAFTRGKKQLSALEVENTRSIAHVRIHVERVIGLVRNKYTILQDKLPIDFLINESGSIPTIDKIAAVCCSLTNFCDSVVSFD